ncbi:MAG: beta-N-acetylhexosaminidase, partial [Bacteroidales bacterium]
MKNSYNIIPAPAELIMLKGAFTVDDKTAMVVSPLTGETALAARFLADMLSKSAMITLPVSDNSKAGSNSIFMIIDTALTTGPEGYVLEVTKKKIELRSTTAEGLFHGVQTIRQLLPPQVEVSGGLTGEIRPVVPACVITDEPRFRYRGMHLDVSRHIFPVEEIKKYIDVLALHKFNTFHWHLTDDQGWRIEIKKYPNLMTVGSQRKETLVGHGGRPPFVYDGIPHGGYFTQEEIREIVKYASDRFITIIPEIEMPGHAMAALASYPV